MIIVCGTGASIWWPRWAMVIAVLLAVSQPASPALAAPVARQTDQATDATSFQTNVNTQTADWLGNRLKTILPKAGEFQVNLVVPVFWQSNVLQNQPASPGAIQGNPAFDLRWSRAMESAPIKLGLRAGTEVTRYSNFHNEDNDEAYIRATAAYFDASDDQVFAPYVTYRVKTLNGPGLADWYQTRNEFTVGIAKGVNFDENFNLMPRSGRSNRDGTWGLQFDVSAQRRLRNPGPDSDAAIVDFGATYSPGDTWTLSMEVELVWRSYAPVGTGQYAMTQHNFSTQPVAALVWDASSVDPILPQLGFSVSFEHELSSRKYGSYQQWTVGPFLAASWRF